jgi:dTDP-3-amino-3,4,6-trideoxy-alpha-D-glucose transaminase
LTEGVPFLDLAAGVREMRAELEEALAQLVDDGRYILGPQVAAFEEEFAAFCGVRHCVGVGNGFDAIHLQLRALGIGAGDEVIVPAYTAAPTWMAVAHAGARPVGVDVSPRTWNMDPDTAAAAVSPRTKAIVAVHLFGQPAAMAELAEIAERESLILLEDAAQAHGARYGGKRVGGLARAAAFSFYPTKNLGALGDAGAVTTDDEALALEVRRLRTYGWRDRDVCEVKGVNSRLDELQAAVLRVRLRQLDKWTERRCALAERYREGLPRELGRQEIAAEVEPVWHIFAVTTEERDAFRAALAQAGIGTLVHYFPLPHLTPAFRADGWRDGAFPHAEGLANRAVSLPMYPQLTDQQCDAVLAAAKAAAAV